MSYYTKPYQVVYATKTSSQLYKKLQNIAKCKTAIKLA